MLASKSPANPAKHFDTIRKTRSTVFLVRERPWNREHHLIDVSAGSLGERNMRAGYRIECSRNDADALGIHRRFFNRNGSTYWITRRFAPIAPA